MSQKQQLGQFNTTQVDKILKGWEDYVTCKPCVDPFAGNKDLVKWVRKYEASCLALDVDPTKKGCNTRDSLLDPMDYTGLYVVTNPPYLGSNKIPKKNRNENDKRNLKALQQYGVDDLYKAAIMSIEKCEGGILIVPLNFLSSERASGIRDFFFSRFRIIRCKAFEEQVFDDTDYTVCAIYFEKKHEDYIDMSYAIEFIPSGEAIHVEISKELGWIAGEGFYKRIKDVTHNISRFTIDDDFGQAEHKIKVFVNDLNRIEEIEVSEQYLSDLNSNIILLKSIDTGTLEGMLGLEDMSLHNEFTNIDPATGLEKKEKIVPAILGLSTSRNLAHLKLPGVSIGMQKRIIDVVNKQLKKDRYQYNSMFLTAFRNSTASGSRKRIGFETMYKLIQKTYEELLEKDQVKNV